MAATNSNNSNKKERLNNGMGELHNNTKKSLNIEQYLKGFKVNRDELFTHTSWGNMKGKYYVPPIAMERFMEIYKFNVENGLDVCITEKHRDVSPVLIDLDFRQETAERLYTQYNVQEFIGLYDHIIRKYVNVGEGRNKYYVLEKPSPRVNKSGGFKDGLHIVCPEIITRPLIQHIIRKEMLNKWENLTFNTGITNKKEDIFDEAVIEKNNWFLYGSKKPDEEFGWKASYVVECVYTYQDPREEDILIHEVEGTVGEFIDLFSIRNKFTENAVQENMTDTLQKFKEERMIKENVFLTSAADLNNTVVAITEETGDTIRNLTMMLSVERASNYHDWIKVGWCLRNISYSLLSVWVEFSKKSTKYIDGECERLWGYMKEGGGCLGLGSLYRWAKADDPEKYHELFGNDLRKLVSNAKSGTEYDVARVVQHMYDGQFVYAPETKMWYMFSNHRWEMTDEGLDLKAKLPTEVIDVFRTSAAFAQARAARPDTTAEEKERLDEINKKLGEVISKLKRAAFQSSVMTELAMLLRSKKFSDNLDEKKNLLGFNNGVFDLDEGVFRAGLPEDMITFSTGNNYNPTPNKQIQKDIKDFFLMIMGTKKMSKFLFRTLAYSLHGDKKWEKFISWIGKKGANGKGTLTALCQGAFGQYMVSSDATLYTTKKTDSGKASPEWMRLKGVRLDILQEPDEDQKLQPSSIKPATGRDKLAFRGLYMSTTEYMPQFQPVMCLNNQPQLAGGTPDGGMERRLLNIPFNKKFSKDPQKGELPMNQDIKTKFQNDVEYHQQFMLMLLDEYQRYKEDGCNIDIPEEVTALTSKYIKSNNVIRQFLDLGYDITNDETDMVESIDVYIAFKASDMYNNLNKPDFKKEMVEKNGFGYKRFKGAGAFRDKCVYTGLKVKCAFTEQEEPKQEVTDDYDK